MIGPTAIYAAEQTKTTDAATRSVTCAACDIAATDPRTGHYRAGCHECDTRALAHSPAYFEARSLGDIETVAYAGALATVQRRGEDIEDTHRRVAAWAKRIRVGK